MESCILFRLFLSVFFSNDNQMNSQYTYMNPLDVQQFLYCLTPVPDVLNDPKVLKGVTNIGKLDIVWKTNMGEKGRLQTSPLQRVVSGSSRSVDGLMLHDVRICLPRWCVCLRQELSTNAWKFVNGVQLLWWL